MPSNVIPSGRTSVFSIADFKLALPYLFSWSISSDLVACSQVTLPDGSFTLDPLSSANFDKYGFFIICDAVPILTSNMDNTAPAKIPASGHLHDLSDSI